MRIAEISFTENGNVLIKPLLGVNRTGEVISQVDRILGSASLDELLKTEWIEFGK